MTININKSYDFSIQQIFAESYWNEYYKLKSTNASDATLQTAFLRALAIGNTRETAPQKQTNYTKLTQTLAEQAYERYEIIDHIDNTDIVNDSGTIIKKAVMVVAFLLYF